MPEINKLNQRSLQEIAAPDGVCFGCGQKNKDGLQIKSYRDADSIHVIMTHTDLTPTSQTLC